MHLSTLTVNAYRRSLVVHNPMTTSLDRQRSVKHHLPASLCFFTRHSSLQVVFSRWYRTTLPSSYAASNLWVSACLYNFKDMHKPRLSQYKSLERRNSLSHQFSTLHDHLHLALLRLTIWKRALWMVSPKYQSRGHLRKALIVVYLRTVDEFAKWGAANQVVELIERLTLQKFSALTWNWSIKCGVLSSSVCISPISQNFTKLSLPCLRLWAANRVIS